LKQRRADFSWAMTAEADVQTLAPQGKIKGLPVLRTEVIVCTSRIALAV
jgi:hypothetical protein